MSRFNALVLFSAIVLLVSGGCRKRNFEDLQDNAFCKLVADRDYELMKPIMTEYFKNQAGKDSVENSELFMNWLEAKPCVDSAWVGKIYTSSPPILGILVVHKTDTAKNFTVYARQVSPLELMEIGK